MQLRSIKATYEKYPKTGAILPAMGYGDAQVRDLEETIDRADVDMVVIATPIDLKRVYSKSKNHLNVCVTSCRRLGTQPGRFVKSQVRKVKKGTGSK